jgi:zinc transport system substrate-binding protein
MRHHGYRFLLAIAGVTLACAEGDRRLDRSTAETPRLEVYTVNYPLAYFAERIGGDLVAVTFPAPGDVDPAYWAPEPEVIAGYQGADLILLNGAGYARWLERATLPATRLVDTSAGLEARLVPLEEATVHSHGLEGEHSHKGFAFTTWLDPELAIAQAKAVAEALVRARPESEGAMRSGLAALEQDLRALDERQRAAVERLGGKPLLFSHPVYQYLVARYGLNARSVHWEPDEAPSETQWRELQEILAEHPARWMIWEGAPQPEVVQRLSELGLESVVYDPCANRPSAGDLLTVMGRNAAALEALARK